MTRSPLLPEVLDGFERALRRKPVRRHWFATRTFAVAFVGVALGGTAIAAVAPWNPLGTGSDAATTTPPPPDQLSTLAVLRHAQTDADRGPLITAYLRRFERHAHTQGRVRVPYVRLLREVETKMGAVDAGSSDTGKIGRALLYLIPQEPRGDQPAPGELRGHPRPDELQFCLSTIYDVWPDPSAPPADFFAGARSSGDARPARPARLLDRVVGGGTCGSAHVVRMKGLSSGGAMGGNVFGIVPDGVAAVRATTRDGRPVQARVTNNSFQLLAPGRNLPPDPNDRDDRPWAPPLSGQFKSGTYEWLDARGKVIRRMPY